MRSTCRCTEKFAEGTALSWRWTGAAGRPATAGGPREPWFFFCGVAALGAQRCSWCDDVVGNTDVQDVTLRGNVELSGPRECPRVTRWVVVTGAAAAGVKAHISGSEKVRVLAVDVGGDLTRDTRQSRRIAWEVHHFLQNRRGSRFQEKSGAGCGSGVRPAISVITS